MPEQRDVFALLDHPLRPCREDIPGGELKIGTVTVQGARVMLGVAAGVGGGVCWNEGCRWRLGVGSGRRCRRSWTREAHGRTRGLLSFLIRRTDLYVY
jgi:hypothetical protein